MPIVDLQHLPMPESADVYLQTALARTRKRISQLSVKGSKEDRLKKKEAERVVMVRDALIKYIDRLIKGWPSIDDLPEFYQRLVDNTLDREKLMQSLGSLKYAEDTIKKLSGDFSNKIRRQEEPDEVKRLVKQYLGRVSSVFKRISKNLVYLEHARKVMKSYPSLDPEQFTIAIAGFPNVGKSTLLSKITTASPEIKNYAFTTKGLNVGMFEYKFSRIQCVDTPGTLGREKENDVERLASLTRQYLARAVVYVYDITEPYPLEDQERLREVVEEEGREVIPYLSKTDVLPKDLVAAFKKKHPDILTSPADVRKAIEALFVQWI